MLLHMLELNTKMKGEWYYKTNFLPRPRNKRLTGSNEPPKHNAVGNVFLQSCNMRQIPI